MSLSIKKYGWYYIASGIAVGGALWFNRPNDPRILGEDYATVFEAIQELNLAYMTGDEVPDWTEWNNSSSNSIYQTIRYSDIQTMANRLREKVIKSDGAIFWTQSDFTNIAELAFSVGDVAITNEVGDTLQDGTVLTNLTYSFSTNVFYDSIVTTATRVHTNGSLFDTTVPIDGGLFANIAKTNALLSNIVYGRGAGVGCTNTAFNTLGSWWPFKWSYAFDWEQWSYPEKSRVTVWPYSSFGVSWTNVCWIATNSLDVSVSAVTTNAPCYSAASFRDVNGNLSTPFVFLKPSDNSWPIYLESVSGESTDYSQNITYSPSWSVNFRLVKQNEAAGRNVTASVVYGDPLRVSYIGGGSLFQLISIGEGETTPTNALSVVALTYDGTNSMYIGFSVTRSGDDNTTNAYFDVTSDRVTESAVTATATTNAVTSDFKATDDKRITTNKLNGLAHVATNLYRTIYIGTVDAISATNRRTITQSLSGDTYVDEATSGSGSTITYYSGYDLDTILSNAQVTDTVTTNNTTGALSIGTLSDYNFTLRDQKWGYYYPDLDTWAGNVLVTSGDHEIKDSIYQGCTLAYPSVWAVTNGYIKRVAVYAMLEAPRYTVQSYYSWPNLSLYGSFNSHSISGEYWHEGNHGISITDMALNVPQGTIEDSREYLNHRIYSSSGNFEFTDTAKFSKIYSVDNPTEEIKFDFELPAVTHGDPATRYAGFDWVGTNTALQAYAEGFSKDYSLGYRIQAKRVLIVVDWDFKHIGRGFTPPTE